MWMHKQVTLAGATPLSAISLPCQEAFIQMDDGGTNPGYVGGSDVTTAIYGARILYSATAPIGMHLGPYPTVDGINLADLYVVGTDGDEVNVLYNTQ